MPGQVTYVITAKDAKAIAQAEKFTEAFTGGARRINREFKKTGRAVRGVGSQFETSMGGMLARMISVTAAIEAGRRALAFFNDERKRGADVNRQSELPLSALMNIAKGPADARRLIAGAKSSSAETGMSIGEGAALQFQLRSLKLDEDRAAFAQLHRLQQDPLEMAKGVSALYATLGKEEVGSASGAIKKATIAAAPSPVLPAQLAMLAAKPAQMAGLMGGVSDEEILSAVSIMAQAVPSEPEVAGTQLRAFMKQAIAKGFTGGGVMGAMRGIREKTEGMSGAEIQKFMGGRVEAVLGYQQLSTREDDIMALQSSVDAAQHLRFGGTERSVAMKGLIPELAASEAERIETAKTDLSLTGKGTRRQQATAAVQRMRGDQERFGLARFIGVQGAEAARELGFGADTVSAIGEALPTHLASPGLSMIQGGGLSKMSPVITLLQQLVNNTAGDNELTAPAGAEAANAY